MSHLTTNDIIDWIYEWKGKNPSVDDETLVLFAKDLNEKMKKLDYSVKNGGEVIGYAGRIQANDDNTGLFHTVKKLTKESNGRYCFINNAADNILNNDDFKQALKSALGEDKEKIIIGGKWDGDVRSKYSFGDNLSLNDLVSDNFMLNNAKGNVILLIADNARYDSTLNITELERLMMMDDVTHINGISKGELLLMNSQERFEFLKRNSVIELNNAKIFRNANGAEILSLEDTCFGKKIDYEIPSDYSFTGETYGSRIGLASDTTLRGKYKLIENCTDKATLDVFRSLEYRVSKGGNAAKIIMGDMVKNFKGNNYLLFKDLKDLRADDFLEFAKHQAGLDSNASAKSLYENSNRLKLTKSLRVAGNVAVAATEIYFTVDFIINLAHLYETGQISAREVGKEAAAYVASTGASWFASSTVASATAVGLPLLGVSAPICAVAVVVFSLAAGIWSGKGADWLMRELYDPAYETTWGAIDVIMSGFNDFHLVDGTDDNDYIDCSSGTITAGILTYPISHRVVIDGMDGDDTLVGSIYDDTIYGGAGNDKINGYLGDDDIYGGSGNDIIYGGTGNDEIRGGDGVDIIYGGSGNDIVYGDGDSDFLYGGSGNDTIYGGTDADEVFGEGGDDELHGDGGDDLVVGGSGEDLIYGGDGDDILSGEDGNDKLYGGNGNDIVLGDDGNDTLYGENGDDILDGGSGDDYLEGGVGNDIYIYGKGSGNDVIYDYYGINTIKFVDLLPEDLRVVYPPSGYDALITIMSTGETLTIKEFRYSGYYKNFKLEFANGRTGIIDYVSALIELDPLTDKPIETAKTEDELAQANANILDELYADDNSVSDLLTENDNTVISEITESASTSDENENTADQIDVQVMILTENMAAFSNESNISDSMNMQSNAESLAFADQLLVGTQAS